MALIKKSCPHCGQLKDVTEFGANVGRPDGLAFYCKVCFRSLARAHYRRSREAQGLEVRPREIAPLGQKWCPDCQSYLFEQEFPRNAAARDGLSSYCKLHHAKRGRRNYF